MAIQINITSSRITGCAEVLENMSVERNADISIELKDVDICNDARVLGNMQIIMNEIAVQANKMDKNTREYEEIRRLLWGEMASKRTLAKRIANHVEEFAQGVVAKIVLGFIA